MRFMPILEIKGVKVTKRSWSLFSKIMEHFLVQSKVIWKCEHNLVNNDKSITNVLQLDIYDTDNMDAKEW